MKVGLSMTPMSSEPLEERGVLTLFFDDDTVRGRQELDREMLNAIEKLAERLESFESAEVRKLNRMVDLLMLLERGTLAWGDRIEQDLVSRPNPVGWMRKLFS